MTGMSNCKWVLSNLFDKRSGKSKQIKGTEKSCVLEAGAYLLSPLYFFTKRLILGWNDCALISCTVCCIQTGGWRIGVIGLVEEEWLASMCEVNFAKDLEYVLNNECCCYVLCDSKLDLPAMTR